MRATSMETTLPASVVLCTYNRPITLQSCLRSLLTQSLPAENYEILVVDNGTNVEATRDTMRQAAGAASHVRYVREPRPGLAGARNAGWRQARGEYVAFIDDDALATPSWLTAILTAFRQAARPLGCVGGRVEAIWEAPRPPWLSDSLAANLSLLHWADQPLLLEPHQWLSGCNMAIPRTLLAQVGGFHVRLGRRGHTLLSMEETLLQGQLRNLGYGVYYDPDIVVWHQIPAERLTQRWFRRRAFWNGVSHALVRRQQAPLSARQRVGLAKTALGREICSRKALARLLAATEADRLSGQCVVYGWIGYVLAILGVVR